VESPASVLGQIATCVKRADEPMGAASREAKPVADLRDGKTVWFRRKKFEDVECSVSGFDG